MNSKRTASKQSESDVLGARDNLVEVQRQLEKDELTISQLTRILKTMSADATVKMPDKEAQAHRTGQHVDCLKRALQAAVTLEFATIPPYLCSLWSIKDNLHPAAKSIREVVQEEMLHMSLVCNLLASIGEVPEIGGAVPSYPGSLPGGVHEGLTVQLSGLTKSALADFLWIERPVTDVPIVHPYSDSSTPVSDEAGFLQHEFSNDTTIGEFYDEIHEAFRVLKPAMSPDNQISGPLAWTIARNLRDVRFIVDTIKHQGEGSENNPEASKGDLSHYYRFLEVYTERQYCWNKKDKVLEDIGPLEFPEVYPVAPVPEGGYQREDVSERVWYYMDQFDTTYTILLNQLQLAWTDGGQQWLIHAYETMFELERYARPLMRMRTPYGGGATYAPCFRYKPDQDKTLKVRPSMASAQT